MGRMGQRWARRAALTWPMLLPPDWGWRRMLKADGRSLPLLQSSLPGSASPWGGCCCRREGAPRLCTGW